MGARAGDQKEAQLGPRAHQSVRKTVHSRLGVQVLLRSAAVCGAAGMTDCAAHFGERFFCFVLGFRVQGLFFLFFCSGFRVFLNHQTQVCNACVGCAQYTILLARNVRLDVCARVVARRSLWCCCPLIRFFSGTQSFVIRVVYRWGPSAPVYLRRLRRKRTVRIGFRFRLFGEYISLRR